MPRVTKGGVVRRACHGVVPGGHEAPRGDQEGMCLQSLREEEPHLAARHIEPHHPLVHQVHGLDFGGGGRLIVLGLRESLAPIPHGQCRKYLHLHIRSLHAVALLRAVGVVVGGWRRRLGGGG